MKNTRVITLTLHPAIDRVVRVESFAPGGTFDGKELLRVPAGKGVNTARVLSQLGVLGKSISAAAWLGANEAQWFADTLKKLNGVESAFCLRDCATRIASTYLEANARETHIKESMPRPSANEEKLLLNFLRKTVSADAVVALCGSAPKGTTASTLNEVFRIVRQRGARFVIADTNGPALDAAAKSGIDMLKGNAAEIGAWLKTGTFEYESALHRAALFNALKRKGAPKSVLITLGAAGAALASQQSFFYAAPPKMPGKSTIVSTTGCGDAATAGIVWSVLRGIVEPAEMLANAVACGTAKLESADPGRLDLKRVIANVRYCRPVAL